MVVASQQGLLFLGNNYRPLQMKSTKEPIAKISKQGHHQDFSNNSSSSTNRTTKITKISNPPIHPTRHPSSSTNRAMEEGRKGEYSTTGGGNCNFHQRGNQQNNGQLPQDQNNSNPLVNPPNPHKFYNNWNYCWSCGFDVEDGHTSITCPAERRKTGHVEGAIRYNTCGGSKKKIHKTLPPT